MSTKSKPRAITVNYQQTGASTRANEMGMRTMQERAYQKRGEQYLLIKSPPASGKSRALMFIALDKLQNQGIKQAIIVVPEKSIGSSFANEPLSEFGFFADWHVEPQWNLCNASGTDGGRADSVKKFLESADKTLVCTHATFRNAVEKFGVKAFDDRLVAVDEFHHVSANPDNRLGEHVRQFVTRDKAHMVAMTGSYFRGDAEAVLHPDDEAKFETVTYTYYEQLSGYTHLKHLDIGYYFYSGEYAIELANVLNLDEKTIIHIPSVNSREHTGDKFKAVEDILDIMGEWQGTDEKTGFQLVKVADGRVLKVADLVDDGDANHRDHILTSLRDPDQKNNKDHVDIIIALGMAKEGFDWIWCEHALTIGYRASLTEIIQIIGRATRDAPGKARAKFTNLIAEPDASEQKVVEAVNDTLKAIAASLLMEQVLAPRFEFTPKKSTNAAQDGFDYGEEGYDPTKNNVGFNESTGTIQLEIQGLVEPKSTEAKRICQDDLNEIITDFLQDKIAIERGMFDEELVPEELTQGKMGKIIEDRYPELDAEDQEAIRQRAVAAINMVQQGKQSLGDSNEGSDESEGALAEATPNTALLDGIRRYAMNVTELDIDLIDRINPFSEAYAVLAKTMSESSLKQVAEIITAKKVQMSPEEARDLAKRALKFKQERGRLPSLTSPDAWEKRMAEGIAYLQRMKSESADG